MSGEEYVAVHEEPILRSTANFIITADIAEGGSTRQWEQLWARRVGENEYELCCIPFFARDLALGDRVECAPSGGKRYVVRRVLVPSGHVTFRVWFGNSPSPAVREDVVATLQRSGAGLEWSSRNLLAVDAEDEPKAQAIADYLWQREQSGDLIYETGRTGNRKQPQEP